MFENQLDDYIVKALTIESQGEGNFMTEAEIAFTVTGLMFNDEIKGDGPVPLRNVKNRMNSVRKVCDENNLLLLASAVKNDDDEVTGMSWKIASGDDLELIAEKYLGIKPESTTTPEAVEEND